MCITKKEFFMITFHQICKIIAFILLSQSILIAQTRESKFAGNWKGELKISNVSLRIVFHINETNGIINAVLDSPDQGAYGIEVDNVGIIGDSISLTITKIMGGFDGTLSADGKLLSGYWKQGGTRFKLDLEKDLNPEDDEPNPDEIDFIQIWEGRLKISAFNVRIVIKLFEDPNGNLSGFMDSPDQGVTNIPLSNVQITENNFSFDVPSIKGEYKSEIIADSNLARGSWSQAAGAYPLNLKKVKRQTEINRPQTPKPPFKYNSEEIEFQNKEAKIKLSGTFTYPEGEGSFPAVVLISGSGAQDRDETIFAHKPFFVIADCLTNNGIAVLRYDDRGTGESGGNFINATTEDFASDANAAVQYLLSRKEINKNKIGLIGHSEGGLIAPMLANKSDDISFIIMLAGPGLPGKDILAGQVKLILISEGEDESTADMIVDVNRKIYDVIIMENDSVKAHEKIKSIYKDFIQSLPEDKRDKPGVSDLDTDQFNLLLNPWFKYFLKYDPHPILEKITIPVLALNGTNDLQVPYKENLDAINRALQKAGNKNYKVMELSNLNHLFQTSETGAVREYGEIEETFSPAALKIISDWIHNIIKE